MDDQRHFEQAMEGVTPLSGPSPPPPAVRKARPKFRWAVPRPLTEEEEVMTALSRLVTSGEGFQFQFHDEYIQGVAPGGDDDEFARLKEGDWAIQDHLDLHYRTREVAKDMVRAFIDNSVRKRNRCVLIIHGRGLHSKDQVPILKDCLQSWLCRGGVGKRVKGFCSAQPHDGGWGALYVLLREGYF